MTPERMREAAQILGELGNGKMANELESLARQAQKESGKVHKGALAAVAALQQVDSIRDQLKVAIKQVHDYEEELERHATDRVNQRKQINDLQRAVSELEPRAAFGDQCYQDRCENAYVEQSVADRERKSNAG